MHRTFSKNQTFSLSSKQQLQYYNITITTADTTQPGSLTVTSHPVMLHKLKGY